MVCPMTQAILRTSPKRSLLSVAGQAFLYTVVAARSDRKSVVFAGDGGGTRGRHDMGEDHLAYQLWLCAPQRHRPVTLQECPLCCQGPQRACVHQARPCSCQGLTLDARRANATCVGWTPLPINPSIQQHGRFMLVSAQLCNIHVFTKLDPRVPGLQVQQRGKPKQKKLDCPGEWPGKHSHLNTLRACNSFEA